MSEFHRKCELLKKFVKEPYEKRKNEAGKTPRAYYAKCCIHSGIYEGRILYECEEGRGMYGSLLALFLELLGREAFAPYEHIWVMESEERKGYYEARWSKVNNVKFVVRGTNEYVKALAECKYLLNDTAFPPYFMKREGQVYLNTWHGMTLKLEGYECPEGEHEYANVIRNFLSADYLVSSGYYMTEVYKKAFRLEGLYAGNIIETGMPYTDLFHRLEKEFIYGEMKKNGIEVQPARKIVLYAPSGVGKGCEAEYSKFYKEIAPCLKDSEYQLLIRPEQTEYVMLSKEERKKGYYVPDTMDLGMVLAVTDLLITDLSDVVFQYLVLERPVIFYSPDIVEYRMRGESKVLEEELPGPVVDKQKELRWWLSHQRELTTEYMPKVRSAKEKYCPYEDGQAAQRVVDRLFYCEGEKEQEKLVEDASKRKLLFYAGTFKTNGVTSSLLGLLDLLDYNKYDVTVYIQPKGEEKSIFSAKDFKKEVRVLVRVPGYNATSGEEFYHGVISELGVRSEYCRRNYPYDLYEREFRRCFGDVNFDEVIDYTGYGSFMARVFLAAPSGRKIIWQHSNMKRDQKRNVYGERPYETELKVVFSLYGGFDAIISCGKEIMEINRTALADSKTYQKFGYVDNAVFIRRIIEGSKKEQIIERQGSKYLVLEAEEYGNTYHIAKMIPLPPPGQISFFMLGRLSPEKNPMAALQAFKKFHSEVGRAMFYLIGDGPLLEQVIQYVMKNKLEEAVVITGNLANPFPLIEHCGCFVLPSKWEGEVLTVREMRVLHKPILLSDYEGHEAVCETKGQRMINTGVTSIYEGMMAYYQGEVLATPWECGAYNEQVRRQFEAMIWKREEVHCQKGVEDGERNE